MIMMEVANPKLSKFIMALVLGTQILVQVI